MQLLEGDLFRDFPDAALHHPAWRRRGALSLGPLPRAGRHAQAAGSRDPSDEQRVLRHLRLPPAGHRPAGRGDRHENILFGSEMVGAVRGIDPTTGHYFDDTKRYIDALDIADAERHAIFEGNARRVFPRLDARLKEEAGDRRRSINDLARVRRHPGHPRVHRQARAPGLSPQPVRDEPDEGRRTASGSRQTSERTWPNGR